MLAFEPDASPDSATLWLVSLDIIAGIASPDYDDDEGDRPRRSSRSRRSRDDDDFDEGRPRRLSGSRRSRDRDDFDEDRPLRSVRPRRSYGHDDSDEDIPHRSTSSRGSSSSWQGRPGQGLAAFPNSTVQGTRHFSQEQTSLQRMLRFGLVEAPKLTKDNLGSAAVNKFIAHIQNLIRANHGKKVCQSGLKKTVVLRLFQDRLKSQVLFLRTWYRF